MTAGDAIHNALRAAAAKGERIRGGCDCAGAYQTLTEGHGTFRLTTHHDDQCPVLRAARAGMN